MKKLKNLLQNLLGWVCIIFTVYVVTLLIQGKNVKQEIMSWFEDDEPALESVMQENSWTREEAFDYLMETTGSNELPGFSEVLPGIPEELTDHVFLNARAAGISSKLVGDVRVIVVFVTNPSSSWTYEEMTEVQTGHEAMTAEILAEAASRGVSLDLSMEYHLATVDKELPDENTTAWADAALASVGLPPSATASADLEAEYGVDEAPILFYLNHSGRAYALPYQSGNFSEYAFFFNADEGAVRYRHELYHLFGAKDFYYPAEVTNFAESYFPNSTMLVSENAVTDDLTAYLIGWTDTLSDLALAFLQDTAFLTPEYMAEQNEHETFTGYVTDYDDADGTYTGYLDFGVPQGDGTKVWHDGRRYEGAWDYGSFHGEGTYTWADGTTYTGSWDHGKQYGYGITTWTDGNSYSGYYVDGLFHGEGTFSWSNGDSFTGEWLEGSQNGYGIYTWADGSTMDGYWENGEYIE